MYPKPRHQSGISLITAIFLLVVVAGLLAATLNIAGVQRGTSILNLKAARALQAAWSGIEWGAYKTLTDGAAPSECDSIEATANDLPNVATSTGMNFSVEVGCTSSTHNESGTEIIVYKLTATATNGIYGSLDYTSRTLSASFSESP